MTDQPCTRARAKLNTWVRSNIKSLEAAVPDLPVEDRAADTGSHRS